MANVSKPSLSQGISSTILTISAHPSITQGENSTQPQIVISKPFTPPLNLSSDNSRWGLSTGASLSYYAPFQYMTRSLLMVLFPNPPKFSTPPNMAEASQSFIPTNLPPLYKEAWVSSLKSQLHFMQ